MRDGSSLSERIWRRPQNIWARRALFQIHLWSGIGVGAYLILISLTGSFLVFRTELHKLFNRPPRTVAISGERLSEDQLKSAAASAHPKHSISNVWPVKKPDQPVEIWLTADNGHALNQRVR